MRAAPSAPIELDLKAHADDPGSLRSVPATRHRDLVGPRPTLRKKANSRKIEAPERRVLLERGGDACDALAAELVAPNKGELMTIQHIRASFPRRSYRERVGPRPILRQRRELT